MKSECKRDDQGDRRFPRSRPGTSSVALGVHCREHFSRSTATMGLLFMAASVPRQVVTSPAFKVGTMQEIGFLKSHRAAGPVGLSPSFFKGDEEVLTSELKLLGRIWTEEETFKDWYKSAILAVCREGDRGISMIRIVFKLLDFLMLAKNVCVRTKPVVVPAQVVLTKFSLCVRSQNMTHFSQTPQFLSS